MRTHRLFLEGRWQEGKRREVIKRPHDGNPVAEITRADPEHVEKAIAFAAARAPDLRRTPLHRRAEVLSRMAELVRERATLLSETIRDEAGKPIQYARGEVQRAAETLLMASVEARRLDGEYLAMDVVPRGEGRHGLVRRVPVGPVAAITPFNFPLNLAIHKVAPAIAAGCPVILKPAERTPISALLLGEIAEAAGLPEGGLQVVPCEPSVAAPLITDARVAMLSFTGSQKVGWELKARAGHKRVTLELGGNAGVLILPDADWTTLLGSLGVGAFAYAGQVCISVQRVMVPQSVRNRFEEALGEHARTQVKSGDPADVAVVNGPMIDDGNARRILDWIDEAKGLGARVLTGAQREGNLVSPTVLSDVDPRARIYREEAFGPVVTVEGFSDLDDAIRRINASQFGLQAGVFTNDLKALWRCFDELEVGGIIHNDMPTFRVDHMPYGGVKESGFGREGVRYAIDEMTERRLMVVRP
ncbi:MAG: aldehyde dehydrogenase family protein [Myxococcota bacterium]